MRLTILCFLLATLASSQDFRDLDTVALDELRATQTPGAAVAVIQGEKVVYTKGFGVASLETAAPVTPDMLFRLGSTTKMFVAAALVQLAEEGKLRLDRPIGDYLPGLLPRLARVTTHQLLTHTAGLADEAPMYGPQDDSALAAGIRSWTDQRFFTDPGRIYSYADPGYWVAGLLVEHLAGKPFADAMDERLFRPLGMTRSTFRPTVAMTYPLVQGHDGGRVARPAANNASGWPAGSLFSSADDLSRFVIAFLHGRVTGSSRLSTGHVDIPGAADRYAYGLRSGPHRGVRLVHHGGNRRGYGSSIRMAPDQRVGVIVLVNKTGGDLPKTSERALELLLRLEPQLAAAPPPQRPATEVTGIYTQGNERLEVLSTPDGLALNEDGRTTPLPPRVVFVPGPSGRIEYLHRGGRSFRRLP